MYINVFLHLCYTNKCAVNLNCNLYVSLCNFQTSVCSVQASVSETKSLPLVQWSFSNYSLIESTLLTVFLKRICDDSNQSFRMRHKYELKLDALKCYFNAIKTIVYQASNNKICSWHVNVNHLIGMLLYQF